MYLHEAIEKAGPGGKGFNSERGQEFSINVDGLVSWPYRLPDMNDYASSDWEVVQEEIEVGDVVKPSDGKRDFGMRVVAKDMTGLCALVADENGLVCETRMQENLALIRKGPKVHTFEGVTVWSGPNGYYLSDNEDGKSMESLGSIHEGRRKHTMTLEEVED